MRDDGYPEVLEARRLGRRRSPVNGLQDLAHCHSGTAVAGTGGSAVTTGRKETLRRQKAPTRQTTGASAIFSSARETYLSLINRWVRSYFSIISASGRRRAGENSLRCVTWAHPLSVERTRALVKYSAAETRYRGTDPSRTSPGRRLITSKIWRSSGVTERSRSRSTTRRWT